MPRLDRLPPANRTNLLGFPAQVNDSGPFTPVTKPLAACRLAIVTTAGRPCGTPGACRGRRGPRSAGACAKRVLRWHLSREGYLAMKPAAGGNEIARWFWGETAVGQLLRRVGRRLDASEDPAWKAAGFGVAR